MQIKKHMGVSKNRGTPKSSILIGFSIINHPFWGTLIFGNTHMKKTSTVFGTRVSIFGTKVSIFGTRVSIVFNSNICFKQHLPQTPRSGFTIGGEHPVKGEQAGWLKKKHINQCCFTQMFHQQDIIYERGYSFTPAENSKVKVAKEWWDWKITAWAMYKTLLTFPLVWILMVSQKIYLITG